LTKANQPTTQQINEYITKEIWMAFLKRHIDAIDEKKSFIDRPENASIFTDFIQSAFKLFVQENLLNKDVINAVKDLNYITVDMEIFTMDGRDILRKLDIRSMLKLDM
jgi:hypothetical protein